MPHHVSELRGTLFIATTNAGKLRDFAKAAASTSILIAPLPGLAAIAAPVEDALTFAGNARIKAMYYAAQAPGKIVLADDSGLEVDALHGAPGVRSARYAEDAAFPGPPGAGLDERNNACLLASLRGVPSDQRPARYRCSMAAVVDGRLIAEADGTVEGEIVDVPRGTSGFGYDPLFHLPEYGKTMAELDPATRLACSHRGRALRTLLVHPAILKTPEF